VIGLQGNWGLFELQATYSFSDAGVVVEGIREGFSRAVVLSAGECWRSCNKSCA